MINLRFFLRFFVNRAPVFVINSSNDKVKRTYITNTNRSSVQTISEDWQTFHRGQVYNHFLIESRPRAFHRAIDEPCTLPISPPKGGTKRNFAIFPVNFKFCRKKSAAKFHRVKTSSAKVVVTSFLYLTVHRWMVGDVPIYLKFALKMTYPIVKCRFRQISLNCAAAVRASEKINYC